MFIEQDIKSLSKLILPITEPPLYEFILDINEQKAVGSYLRLIVENLYIPKHKRDLQTLIIKKLFTTDFSLYKFIENVTHSITGGYEIRISLSFLVHKGIDHDTIKYFFAIPHNPLNKDNRIIESKADIEDLLNFLKPLSRSQLLNHVFYHTNSDRKFESSGFQPRKLVLAVVWLTKINGSI